MLIILIIAIRVTETTKFLATVSKKIGCGSPPGNHQEG